MKTLQILWKTIRMLWTFLYFELLPNIRDANQAFNQNKNHFTLNYELFNKTKTNLSQTMCLLAKKKPIQN